jgi:plasmid stability protein
MATLTIRNVPPHIVNSLKSLARKKRRSMEQEIREVLEDYVAERHSVLGQIEAAWSGQKGRPTPKQVEKWIAAGRD